MIRDCETWREFERQWAASEPRDFHRDLRLLDAMYELARKYGVLPGPDPLEGIEVNIRLSATFRRVPHVS